MLSLCGSYRFRDWKPLLALVTAFTLGHSITLALSVLGKLPLHTAWGEFLIPVTIALTALWQLQQGDKKAIRTWDCCTFSPQPLGSSTVWVSLFAALDARQSGTALLAPPWL